MKRLLARPVTILALLLITGFATLLWQSRPNSSQKRQGHLNDSLLKAAMYGDAAAVQDLLRNGADPNSCQQPSSLWERLQRVCPALHYIDHSDPQPLYETALGIAVLNGKTQVVRVLLAGGADVQRKDSYGQTALDLANPDNDNSFLMLKEVMKKRGLAKGPAGSH